MILPFGGGPLNVFLTILLLPFIIAWSLFRDGVVEPILRRLRRVGILPLEGNIAKYARDSEDSDESL